MGAGDDFRLSVASKKLNTITPPPEATVTQIDPAANTAIGG